MKITIIDKEQKRTSYRISLKTLLTDKKLIKKL